VTIPRSKKFLGVASQARIQFQDASADLRSFHALRQMLKDRSRANRHINKVAKGVHVLIAAIWEAYCEDLALEAATLLVKNAADWEKLPRHLTRRIAKELREDKHELAPWKLAGDGWRSHVLENLTSAPLFNVPKSEKIDDLFLRAIGLPAVSANWTSPEEGVDLRARLHYHVNIRGAIAHGAAPTTEVTPAVVSEFYQTVMQLVELTDESVRVFIESTIGFTPWEREGMDQTDDNELAESTGTEGT
jgi:hypothetical protein